jgi:hypothetical protein
MALGLVSSEVLAADCDRSMRRTTAQARLHDLRNPLFSRYDDKNRYHALLALDSQRSTISMDGWTTRARPGNGSKKNLDQGDVDSREDKKNGWRQRESVDYLGLHH